MFVNSMNPHLLSMLFVLGSAVLPLCYLALCLWMLRYQAWWFTYIAYFFLFGSIGGWCLALQFPSHSILLMGFWSLYVLGAFGCLCSSLVLSFRQNRSWFDVAAMAAGWGYLAVLALGFIVAVFATA